MRNLLSLRVISAIAAIVAADASAMLIDRTALAGEPTTAECVAANHSSLQLGNEHKLRAERRTLLVCASASCPAAIRKECLAQVEEVKNQIPTVIFAAKDAAGADLMAVRVSMDGEVLADRLEGVSLAVDPGPHTFTFEVPGQTPITKTFLMQEGQHDRREVITFGAPRKAVDPSGGGGTPPSSIPGPPASTEPSQGLGTQKVLALVVGGIGVMGLGLGTAFGVYALAKRSDAQNACPGQCTTAAGEDKWNDVSSAGNVSTISFIVGGVGVAGALTLWLTAPSSRAAPSTQVGLGPGTLQLRGSW
jgi:hypothetical protein